PYRHFCRQFLRWYPVGQQAGAWRKSHSLKPSVEHPQNTKCQYRRAKSKNNVAYCRKDETNNHEISGIDPVTNKTVDKFRNTIDQTMQCQKNPQFDFCYPEVGLHGWHGYTQVLTDKVEQSIA